MWNIPLGVVHVSVYYVFATVASVWTTLLEAAHVLLRCVPLAELELFPFDLRLTPTLSLCGERTLTQATLSTHQAREPHFSKTKQTTLMCWQARAKENHEDNGNRAIIPDGTPTPNGVRSCWDFIPRRSPKCWRVQHRQQIINNARAVCWPRSWWCMWVWMITTARDWVSN